MATGFTSSATTVTTVADLYKKQNTDVKIAVKLFQEEADWFRDYPKENIVVSGNENRVPLVLTKPLPAAHIPEGGNERIMNTPAPTHGTFLPVQADVRHGFTGLAQAYDNTQRGGMIENQLTYQANMSGYSFARTLALTTYGTSSGTMAQVKTTGSASATQVVPLKNAYGSATFVTGGDGGVQDTYLSSLFDLGVKVALIRASAVVEFGTVTASPSASSGVGYIDITFNSTITPTANDNIVFAMADGDNTITGTDWNNSSIGFTDILTGTQVLGVSTSSFPFWAPGSKQTTSQRLSYATKQRLIDECWTASGMRPDRFILPYGVNRDAVSGELGARRYDSADVDIEGNLNAGKGQKYYESPTALPNTLIGWNRNVISKVELSNQPEQEASKSLFKLDKVQGKSQTAAYYDFFYQRIPTVLGATGYAANLTMS